MMLVESIAFVGPNSQVHIRVIDGGRAEMTVDARQQIILTLDQIRAVQSALTRILEGR